MILHCPVEKYLTVSIHSTGTLFDPWLIPDYPDLLEGELLRELTPTVVTVHEPTAGIPAVDRIICSLRHAAEQEFGRQLFHLLLLPRIVRQPMSGSPIQCECFG